MAEDQSLLGVAEKLANVQKYLVRAHNNVVRVNMESIYHYSNTSILDLACSGMIPDRDVA